MSAINTYNIGLTSRHLDENAVYDTLAVLQCTTSLTETYPKVEQSLFTLDTLEAISWMLTRYCAHQTLDQAEDPLESVRGSQLGLRIGLVGYYMIRLKDGFYQPPVPCQLPELSELEIPKSSSSEHVRSTNEDYSQILKLARTHHAARAFQKGSYTSFTEGLIAGTDFATFLLDLRHQILTEQFETSDLDPELEAISQLDASPQTSSLTI